MRGMKKLWGRKVSDYGFAEFLKILEHKAREHGKLMHKIDRFFPSTQQCASCEHIKKGKDKLTLRDRIYVCKEWRPHSG